MQHMANSNEMVITVIAQHHNVLKCVVAFWSVMCGPACKAVDLQIYVKTYCGQPNILKLKHIVHGICKNNIEMGYANGLLYDSYSTCINFMVETICYIRNYIRYLLLSNLNWSFSNTAIVFIKPLLQFKLHYCVSTC